MPWKPIRNVTVERIRQLIDLTNGHSGDGLVFPLLESNENHKFIYSSQISRPSDADPNAMFFTGGLYWPAYKPTCGSNSNGAPCYESWTVDTNDNENLNPQCYLPKGETRRICYTTEDKSHWGYCDCDGDGWSRPFGKWETTWNTNFRQGDVIMITDELDGPINNVACDNGKYNHEAQKGQPNGNCKFGSDATLCLHSEQYRTFKPWSTSGENSEDKLSSSEVACPAGEVLTGLALTRYNAEGTIPRTTNQYEEGLIPRCGKPAGWSVAWKGMENEEAYIYPEVDAWRDDSFEFHQDFMPCPYEHVAVGLKWFNRGSANTKGEMMLRCAKFKRTDGLTLNSKFKRACEMIECTGGHEDKSPHETIAQCIEQCEINPDCMAAELLKTNGVCRLHKGICRVNKNPYQSDLKSHPVPKESSLVAPFLHQWSMNIQ